jgi:hypothetical protein
MTDWSGSSLILVSAVVGAGLLAAMTSRSPAAAPAVEPGPAQVESLDPMDEGEDEALPPGHPPVAEEPLPGLAIPGAGAAQEAPADGDEGALAISWKAPARWSEVPNASSMRIASYHVPAASAAADEAELSVVRAGGSTEANLQRWIEQFADGRTVERSTRMVRGLEISIVEVAGTFQAAGMGAADSARPRPGWMLRGAVVETDQGSYFFKLTGPSASVRAARADFDALLGSIAPKVTGSDAK